MNYTVTPYDDYKGKKPHIDVGALIFHPEKDRDMVMQVINILQPATKHMILLRVNNHSINAAMLDVILYDLKADDLIKAIEKPREGKRKKTEIFYTVAVKA